MIGTNLVLKVRTPPALYLGPDGNGDGEYHVAGVRCRTGFPAWPSAPDLLVKQYARELCGVAYQVPHEFRVEVRVLAGFLDAQVVQYIGGSLAARPAAYAGESDDVEFLQFKWSAHEPDGIELAQLSNDFWYYSGDERKGTDMQRFWAFGLRDLPEILDQYELRFPEHLAVNTNLVLS